jgi:deoxycytidylate deaminase
MPTRVELAGRAEVAAFREAIIAAIGAARGSTCAKDQRGAAVWHHNYGHMVAASNGPPTPFVCDGSSQCAKACGKLAVHAEERALLAYMRGAGGMAVHDMQVLHIRVVGGEPVTSGTPSCITCSRTMLEAGVSWVWLWHDAGWTGYSAADFHAASLAHDKHRLPVMRQ